MTETRREAINRANPNDLADFLRKLGFGDVLAGHPPQQLRRENPAPDASVDSTLEAVVLPAHRKAATILRATVLAGGVTGELAPQTYGTTPSTGQIAVSPSGDIVVLASDAITSLDVTYVPERGELADVVLAADPATGFVELPPRLADKTILLSRAEILEGSATGAKEILVPASSAPAAGNARLSIPKNRVHFAVADGPTKVRLWLVVAPAKADRLHVAMDAVSTFL